MFFLVTELPLRPTPILRETNLPPLDDGGVLTAVLSLLQPRPLHKRAFRMLQRQEGYATYYNGPLGLWEDVSRLRETYLASINNLVVFLGLLGRLGGVFEVLQVGRFTIVLVSL